MAKKIKYRERMGDSKYGDWWDCMYYGTFHGWGCKKGTTAAIIEIDYHVSMPSRNDFKNEGSEKKYEKKGMLVLAILEEDFIQFIEE